MPRQTPQVNQLLRQAALCLGIGILLTALLWLSGLDNLIAKAIYSPQSAFGHLMRNSGTYPGALFITAALILTLLPKMAKKYPLTRTSSALIVLTALLAGGLANQVLIQDLVNRPRPRESVLLAQDQQVLDNKLSGNSMPSGHAAMGFIFAAPFFLLRRQRPVLAYTFLATGLIAGATIGLGRMVLGAHFASDVLMAGVVELTGAALLTAAILRYRAPSPRTMALLTLAALAALMLGNRFTATLVYTAEQPWNQISLPCALTTVPNASISAPTLQVQVTGYGAPQSTLALTRTSNNIITLRRWMGLFWGLQCTGVLHLPTPQYE